MSFLLTLFITFTDLFDEKKKDSIEMRNRIIKRLYDKLSNLANKTAKIEETQVNTNATVANV